MTLFYVLLVLFVAGVCSGSPASRIVNGRPATIESYPSIVQLEFFRFGSWNHNCGGTILNQLYILSAAQCTDVRIDPNYTPANRRIRAGSTFRNSGGVIGSIASVLNHPDFMGSILNVADGDISIIRLRELLTFGEGIKSISIVPQGYDLPDGVDVTLAGWGATSALNPESPVLLTVDLVHRTTCEIIGQNQITENMICAGTPHNIIEGACRGDAGGPLYVQGILAGVVSWFPGCQNLLPTVSTRVASYTDWILENTV